MIIGLISMRTGSTELEEIQRVCSKHRERGLEILGRQPADRIRGFIE
jgi:hypothetical protein